MAESPTAASDREHNLRHTLVYQNLRDWIAEADRHRHDFDVPVGGKLRRIRVLDKQFD